MASITELKPLYVFYPDNKVECVTEWPDSPPQGTVVYDPADLFLPWFWCLGNGYAGNEIKYEKLPKWIKAYALLI